MPHIIVKYSPTDALDFPVLLNDLHQSLSADETVKLSTVKTYAEPITHCVVSDDEQPNNMIHIQVRMKPGREEDRRKKMSSDLHQITRDHVDRAGYQCAVSVEMHELDGPTYISSYSI